MPAGCTQLLIAIIVLILLSAFFSATETAYTSINKLKLKSQINAGDKRAEKVYALSENYESLLTTILIGNNIVNLSAATLGGLFFAKIITAESGVDSSVISTIVLTVVVLVFGEITPKTLAKSMPDRFARAFYYPIMFFYYIFFPLNLLFRAYQKLLSLMFRVKEEDAITDEQLLTIVDAAEEDGVLEEDESELVRSALEFGDSEVGDIIVPRVKIVAVPIDAEMDEVRKKFNESGFSRLLVYKENKDEILGFIHEKDFYNSYLNGGKDIVSILAKVESASEHTKISDLLKTLQGKKCQIAVVYDEYGGVVGMVTIEDILEELVGEIWDEHDTVESTITKMSEDTFTVQGDCNLDTFFDETELTYKDSYGQDSNTVGGWLTEQFEGIPEVGESVDIDNMHFEIVKASDKQILEVKLKVLDKEEVAEREKELQERREKEKRDKKDKDDEKKDRDEKERVG